MSILSVISKKVRKYRRKYIYDYFSKDQNPAQGEINYVFYQKILILIDYVKKHL